ncbi:MAG: alpha/beta hydrolase [Chloroflexia bacterium]
MAIATAEAQTAVMSSTGKIGTVISKDGTTIGYRQLGHGAAVILMHGGMESSLSHIQLAELLADKYTVYMPDRRGRGMSGPFGKDYTIQKDVEDIDALLTKTGAHDVFGVSAGGAIMLQAALSLPAIQKIALFEPALIVNNSISTAFLKRYDEEIAQGDTVGALVTAMLGSQMGPPIFNSFPRGLLKMLTKMIVSNEDKKAKAGDVTMSRLAPTLHYDFVIVSKSEAMLESLKSLRADVLLLGGSKSPAYLKTALDALTKVFPKARRVEFPGLGHGASGNKDRGGKPELVAQELGQFFG